MSLWFKRENTLRKIASPMLGPSSEKLVDYRRRNGRREGGGVELRRFNVYPAMLNLYIKSNHTYSLLSPLKVHI